MDNGATGARAVVCLIGERETILFPLPAEQFPVLAKTFPVLICREFVYKTLKLIREFMSKITKPIKKIANSLLFSLFSGNSGPKSGDMMVRHEHVLTIRRDPHLANRATISTWAE
jgi:hypothetical protein